MSSLFSNLLTMSIAGSIVVGLLLLLRPLTVKAFSASWQYGIGKIAIAFFLIPVFHLIEKFSFLRPLKEIYPVESSIILKVLPSSGFAGAMDTLEKNYLTMELKRFILFIWFMGVIVFTGWHLYCYLKFNKQLKADSLSIPGPENIKIKKLLATCKTELGIQSDVKLMLNSKIASPMLVGLYHPIILLPTSNVLEADLKPVLTHELTHLKQKDLWVKIFALIAGTLHWFNPFAYILRQDISRWSELSCDEKVALSMTHEERKLYGEAILNTLSKDSNINSAFCSSLCQSKKHIKRRLTMLLNVKKMKKHIVVVAVVTMIAIAGIGSTISVLAADHIKGPNPNEGIDAFSLQLSHGGEFISKELEKDQKETEPLTENEKMSTEGEIINTKKFGLGIETLISAKLSDEAKFTSEQWKAILQGMEDGTIMIEAE